VFEPRNDAGLDPRIVLFRSVPWDRGRRGNDRHGMATAQPCFIFYVLRNDARLGVF
jgi:hypothetical protein